MPATGGAGASPPTYVFEDRRGVLLDHVLRADLMLTARGKRKIGIYGSTNVSPISRRAMRSGVSRSAAWKRSIGSRKPSALKRKV